MHVYMYTTTYACTHMHIDIHAYMHTCTHSHIHIHMQLQAFTKEVSFSGLSYSSAVLGLYRIDPRVSSESAVFFRR